MDYNTIDWVFSTLPQILAAFVGLLVTGVIFFYSKIGNEIYPEDTWYGIIQPFQTFIWRSLKKVLAITIIFITIDLCILANDKAIASSRDNYYYTYGLCIMNSSPIIIIFMVVIDIMKPDKIDDIIHNIAKKTKTEGEDRINTSEFLNHFINLEKNVRKRYSNVGKNTGVTSLRKMMQYYYETGVINQEELALFQNALQLRNMIVHGGEINQINKNIDESIRMINRKFLSSHYNNEHEQN